MPSGPGEELSESKFDVTEQQIAKTYARGFLGALESAGDDVQSAVDELVAVEREALAAHPRFTEALGSAFLEHEDRVAMVDRVFGGRVQGAVLNLMKVLSAHERIVLLGEVARQARMLHNEALGRVEVRVTTADPADPALLSEIGQAIGAKLGFEPVLVTAVDPEMIGGVEIRVGDTVFDGSLRTAFKKAHRAIVDQTIDAIETHPERFYAEA
ncbi:ATP synthase subunit delta [Pseudobythopirellula maris]|uniref:ATP synthase subunit delta n=1 Tax=Pseudobythopirellula maris TaxID=2527991 RepID=A0A5C5ZS93_9BACT|nr:ATP synthase F1 subunit delta [Pseudobythopirellula maris]TWT89938.1 ATP synthase subunit delta [Pseudobythopirellula maris]